MPKRGPQSSPHHFKKGESGNPKGRKKGVPNKFTTEMKTMVEQALLLAGTRTKRRYNTQEMQEADPGVAYLVEQAEKNPVAFMTLLGKLIPTKIDLDVQVMSSELLELMAERRKQLLELRQEHEVPAIDAEYKEID